MSECIFCKIAAHEIPSTIVYEDAETFAFLDIKPVNPGHTLVIPKKHATDIFDTPEETWLSVMKTAQKIAKAIDNAIAPEGVNIHVNNRQGAGQIVFHSHVHVIPRRAGDGHEHWKGQPYAEGQGDEVAQRIRKALA